MVIVNPFMVINMAKEKSVIQIVLYAVAMAMGLVAVVIMILGSTDVMEALSLDTIVILLGIGVFCVGMAGLNKAT